MFARRPFSLSYFFKLLFCVVGIIFILNTLLTGLHIYTVFFQQNGQVDNYLDLDEIFKDVEKTSYLGNSTKVPKIIHQVWFDYMTMPRTWEVASRLWSAKNPNFTYMLWNEKSIISFLHTKYPKLISLFYSYTYPVQRIDMIRYVILYHYGGIYSDFDIELISDLNLILDQAGSAHVCLAPTNPFGFATDLMMAAPRSNFMKFAVLNLFKSNHWYIVPYLTIMLSTGPMYLTGIFKNYPNKSEIYVIPKMCYEQTCFHHLEGGSWHGVDGKMIWYIYQKRNSLLKAVLIITFFVCLLISTGYISERRKSRRFYR